MLAYAGTTQNLASYCQEHVNQAPFEWGLHLPEHPAFNRSTGRVVRSKFNTVQQRWTHIGFFLRVHCSMLQASLGVQSLAVAIGRCFQGLTIGNQLDVWVKTSWRSTAITLDQKILRYTLIIFGPLLLSRETQSWSWYKVDTRTLCISLHVCWSMLVPWCLDQLSVIVVLDELIKLATPNEFDDIEASTAESSFVLLEYLWISSDRSIQSLVVAVDDEDHVVQSFSACHWNGSDGFGLVHLTIANKGPHSTFGCVSKATEVKVAEEPRLIHCAQRAQTHRDRGILPECGHQPWMGITGNTLPGRFSLRKFMSWSMLILPSTNARE